MTRNMMTSKVIYSAYSDDYRLSAEVVVENDKVFVDFYRDEVTIDSREVTGHSLRYAEDMAENYVLGVLTIDTETWRVNV